MHKIIFLAFFISQNLLIGESLGLSQAENILGTANLVFFYGDSYQDQRSIPLTFASQVLRQPEYDVTKKTLLYIFGFRENMEAKSVKTIVTAYQLRDEHNLLVLDWSKVVAGNYVLQVFPDAIKFSNLLADAILEMFINGLDIENFHIVAHSLGCQLASITARKIKQRSNVKIKRISALDPAFPLFYPGLIAGHLSKDDADFVDVIHTDAFLYGAPISTGTADFWPNGGKTTQPGCPKRNFKFLSQNDLCSHWRSWQFWAESVASSSSKIFKAHKCDSWHNFSAGRCFNNEIVVMGQDCPVNVRGNFFLQTNNRIPFARGLGGASYRVKSE